MLCVVHWCSVCGRSLLLPPFLVLFFRISCKGIVHAIPTAAASHIGCAAVHQCAPSAHTLNTDHTACWPCSSAGSGRGRPTRSRTTREFCTSVFHAICGVQGGGEVGGALFERSARATAAAVARSTPPFFQNAAHTPRKPTRSLAPTTHRPHHTATTTTMTSAVTTPRRRRCPRAAAACAPAAAAARAEAPAPMARATTPRATTAVRPPTASARRVRRRCAPSGPS